MEHSLAGRLDADQAREIVAVLRRHAADVADEAVREIEREFPEYSRPHDPVYARTLRQMVAWPNARFLDLLVDPGTPMDDMLAFFREVGAAEALNGSAPESWQRPFRVGTGVSVRRFSELATDLPGVSPTLVGAVVQQVFAFQNQIMEALAAGYASARARTERERPAQRRALADLLLSDAPAPDDLERAALAADWPLPRTLAAVAVRPRATGGDARPGVPGDVLAALHVPEPCLLVPDPDGPGRRAALDAGLRDWIAAVGPTVAPREAARSLTWARRALGLMLAGAAPDEAPVRALDQVPLLIVTRDGDLLGDLAADRLAPLDDARPAQKHRLAETLLAYLECGFNAAAVARRLSVHPQTVRYRLGRLDGLFGTAMHDPDRQLELQLALRHWLRENPGED
ncbi:PucR family transcriptional regulator [Actinomadura flavalba]|uniref:PucR family transcriptional regulator n=1 Tax=Actinomadura flavalba TaxID=1120938 RepID=UPI00036B7CBD|nr:PucR family transcriptional regulator [Actinomadura flavalba]